MEKIISFLLIITMLIIPTAFADESVSGDLQRVLIAVKSKIDVPDNLGEFESNISGYGEKVYYNFNWHSSDYEKSFSASADKDGNLISVSNYAEKVSDKTLSVVSKNEIIAFADSFVEKAFPDICKSLEFDADSYGAGGSSRYYLTYNRYINGIPVKDNYVHINVHISENDTPYIGSMSANIDYQASFKESTEGIVNRTERYMEAFPIELVYRSTRKKDEKETHHELIYQLKDNFAGFISAETGGIVTEDTRDVVFKEESTNDSVMGAAPEKGDILTEQELAEISNVKGLLSISQTESKVKSVPYIKFPANVKPENNSLYKNSRGEYVYNLFYSSSENGEYNYVSLTANAMNGKLLSYNCTGTPYDDRILSESQKAAAEKAVEKFLGHVAEEEFKSTEENSERVSGNLVNKYYHRTVNGIKHINNGISVTFDTKASAVTYYSLNFTDGTFDEPEKVVDNETAYKGLFDYSPLIPLYVKSGGEFVVCYTLKNGAAPVNAITGKIENSANEPSPEFSYTDIKGHWAEEAATKLAEIQIGFPGGKLNPKNTVIQEEYLRLLASGIYGKYYRNYTQDELYDALIREKIIFEEEKNPTSAVTREQSFVYLIRLADLEKVAKLENIYKVTYADSNKLSPGKIGYCAILSGLGVICGSGGYLRPTDNLNRAEAITMLYRYLMKN